MKATDLFREIRKGNLSPLYYFWGPEGWLIEEAVGEIEAKALSPSTRAFNREVLDAGEKEAESIVASLQAFPVGSPRRLVVIRQADLAWKKTPLPFIEYFQDPNPKTCAVFIGEKTDYRTKFFQTLEKIGAVVSFYPPFEKDLYRWVHSQAEKIGCSIADEAVALLVERVGPSLREIRVELEKLTLGKPGGKRIEERDILALTEDTRSENPFDLPPAVGRMDFREALRLLHKNLQQGEPPVLLFNLVVRQVRMIQRARGLLGEGLSRKEVEGKLRVLPRKAGDFWRQVEMFFPPSPDRLWERTLKADQKLKLSRAEKGLILEEYLLSLLGQRRNAVQAAEGPFPRKK